VAVLYGALRAQEVAAMDSSINGSNTSAVMQMAAGCDGTLFR